MKVLLVVVFHALLAMLLIAGAPLPAWLWMALAGGAIGVAIAGILSRRSPED